MTIQVNTHNEQEEKVLLAFLNRLEYDYQTNDDVILTVAQQEEILRRDRGFVEGKTIARPWSEINQ